MGFPLVPSFGMHPTMHEARRYPWGMSAIALLAGDLLIGFCLAALRGVPLVHLSPVGMIAGASFPSLRDEPAIYDLPVLMVNATAFLLLARDMKSTCIESGWRIRISELSSHSPVATRNASNLPS
jgi:hypothetical protein